MTSPSQRPCVPASAVAVKARLKVGCFVITLIAPPCVLRPNSVPCGPRSTSTRSMSMKVGGAPVVARGTSLAYITTDASSAASGMNEPTPRMLKTFA